MIDLLMLVVIVWYAIAGTKQGLAVGALSLGGFIGGAVLGMRVIPMIADRLLTGASRSVVLLVGVLVTAWLGQVLGSVLGGRVRRTMARSGAGTLDQVLGGVAGLLAISLVLWFVGGAVRQLPNPTLARAVSGSRVLHVIDAVVPSWMAGWAGGFRQAVSDSPFPRVFEGVARERIQPVSPPNSKAVPAAVQAKIKRSVVKIVGDARSCGRGQEGSGVVVAPHRVVTNAHVVAAVNAPQVMLAGSDRRHAARVVLFDPRTDLAVLAVPDLTAPALPLGDNLERNADAVVAGYPDNGPYRIVPARVRAVLQASGEDIYGGSGAERQVYSLFATVHQGNSGGPLIAADGTLAGIVFAKSLDDEQTGYALTMDEVRDEIARGVAATTPIGTGRCAAG
ncbi:MAG: MarP family serine protease [Kineosporiaceae bacterium]|nr:MarP family serine protease [Kineosporiaceae bacterium]